MTSTYKSIFIYIILLTSLVSCSKSAVSKISLHEESSSSYYFDDDFGVINSESVNILKKPSQKASSIMSLLNGTVIKVLKTKTDDSNIKWCKVKYRNQTGWVKQSDMYYSN